MKKWTLSAILYVIVVVAGYSIVGQFFKAEELEKQEEISEHGHTEEEHGHQGDESGESHGGHGTTDSDVNVEIDYKEGILSISLNDSEGEEVTNLELNHEKYMHVIVVDEQLEMYQHIHPNDIGAGKYEAPISLQDGTYKIFVDIKPKNLSYSVEPIVLSVGEETEEHSHGLQPDTGLTKEVEGQTVTLQMSSQKAHEPVTLDFELDTTELEPYLGAMGHVVILDEQGEQYLHVHPKDSDKPVFGTEFEEAGIYKIWAEFKQGGKVRVFPYVVEIK